MIVFLSYHLAYALLCAYLLFFVRRLAVPLVFADPDARLFSIIMIVLEGLINETVQMIYTVVRFCIPLRHPAWLLCHYPAWLLDMAKMNAVGELRKPDFAAFRHLLSCDNLACGKTNPFLCCSRCHSAYYCSAACQRKHWKHGHQEDCQLATHRKALWQEDVVELLSASDHSNTRAIKAAKLNDTSCGICFEDKIAHPVVLPKCKHIFCFSCISKYQATANSPMESDNKSCPYCRIKIDGNIAEEAFEKAQMLLKRVEMLVDDNDKAGRKATCRTAMLEIDKVLDADKSNVPALLLRADIMKKLDPHRAISMYQDTAEAIRVDMGPAQQTAIRSMIDSAQERGRIEEAQILTQVVNAMGQFDLRCQLGLAQSYEATGRYKKAVELYLCIADRLEKNRTPTSEKVVSELMLGISRSYHHLGGYKLTIATAERLVTNERHVGGGHMVMAKAVLALAKQKEMLGAVVTTKSGWKFSVSLAGAVKIMYQGVVCEAPWNDKNKRANLLFLQELLDTVGSVGTSCNRKEEVERLLQALEAARPGSRCRNRRKELELLCQALTAEAELLEKIRADMKYA